MNFFRQLSLTSLLAAALLPAAHASDWSGFYLGGIAGLSNINNNVETGPLVAGNSYFSGSSIIAINSTGNQTAHNDNTELALTMGYNLQSGGLVYGGELDLGSMRERMDREYNKKYPCCAQTYDLRQQVATNGLLTLRARLGAALGASSLLYVTGGAAMTDLSYRFGFSDSFGNNAYAGGSEDVKPAVGWVAGFGYEGKVDEHSSWKVEYLHADFGQHPSTFYMTSSAGNAYFKNSVALSADLLRLGYNMSF